eukprot:767447-Hanusia_phi.AAC.5
MLRHFLSLPCIVLRGDSGCPDCFDTPPAVVGWDLGFPDVTNPTYAVEPYSWRYIGDSRDKYCPECFEQPTGIPEY